MGVSRLVPRRLLLQDGDSMKRALSIRPLATAILFGSFAFSACSVPIYAQNAAATTQALLDKAHALELRGRMDIAAQTWQQVLLADPTNTVALSGLARSAKLSGNNALANTYLERLKAINPNDPGIARAQNTASQQSQNAQLQQAGKLASSGQYAQAMAIYRRVLGSTPPPGDYAIAYYETEAATEEGRPHAIAGLRALVQGNPGDARYGVALGRILTYNPKTRAEGRRYLERYPQDPQAAEALRQSLVWDAANPAAAPDIKSYLAKHDDAQLTQALQSQPKRSAAVPAAPRATRAAMPSGGTYAPPAETGAGFETSSAKARAAEIEEAYRALNAKRIDEAELRFKAVLGEDGGNPRALAGMGYVRMQQSNFGAALSFLEQAKQEGAADVGVDTALATSRFWFTMGEASAAFNENDLPTAEQKYQAALTLRPDSPEALEGLGGTLLKAQQPEAAMQVYERYERVKPSAAAAWRGLFMAQYNAGNAPQALLTERRIPQTVRPQLLRDPDFLRTLASAYSAVGRDADAQRVLRGALDLPFPANANGLKVETQLQYASLLLQANHLDQASGLFRQILASDMSNTAAWQGLIRVEHAMKQDAQALQALQNMPPANYEAAMRDPGFQTTVAAIYQAENKLDTAQEILERSVTQQTSANQKPSTGVLLQLAGIYLTRNNAAQAYPIYRQILADNPDRPDAWKGLLTALHTSGRDQEALAQVQQIPPAARRQLESDVEYLQTIGAVYNSLGEPRQAMVFINRVQQHYTLQHASAPADIDIQDAWLLFNGGNDAGLYRQLMLLGGRQDLSDEQRRTVQTIWTNWAVRRANQSAAAGNVKRSIAILNAAAKAFPDNPGVLRALASGYARAGLPKQAVAIFKTQDLTAASASDYKAAVGAALAAGDIKSAETWLRYGLDQYPRDAQMLSLGAKFEQSRGNSGRAADYFRASLAALPPGDPGAELAAELSQPMPVTRLPGPSQSQDLASLLSTPGNEGMDAGQQAQATPPAAPYLPNYGNAYGQAPVQVPGSSPYTGSSVPSYMANPEARSAQRSGAKTRLRDYVPQGAGGSLSNEGNGGQSQNTPDPSPYSPGDPSYVASTSPRHAIPQSQADIYGPYVPYIPSTQNSGYTPSPVPLQLGDNTPHNLPPQPEITDVLPTARYMPNAVNGNSHATHTRLGRTPTTSASSRTGVSTPPAEDLSSPPTRNAQFGGQTNAASQQTGDSEAQQYPQPSAPSNSRVSRAPRRNTAPTPPPPVNAGSTLPALNYPGVGQPLDSQPYPALGPAVPGGTPPTDAELAAKNVPPLRGSYDSRAIVPGQQLSQRAQTEIELATMEASYSGWIGGTGIARYRSGTSGFDRLVDIEAPFEASAVLGKTLRVTVVPRPVFLNSGSVDNTLYQNPTTAVPVLGTLPANATNAPSQQFSSGIGGELQLTTTNFGLALGYTPYEFLVSNITGRVQWRPFGGHFTLFGDRDSVKDTQLSYAGLRDPGSSSPVFAGNIWGGVISTGGGARIDLGSDKAGLYVAGSGATLTGYHVLDNRKYEGTMGAYFRAHRFPGYGSLNVGGSFFAMHYDHNERGMTYGQGGYFSPNVYFLASVPVTFNGYYGHDFHYSINGSVGVQTFQEASAPYYPLDTPLQTGSGNALYGLNSNTGLNYATNSEASYRVADHWYVGGFIVANNTNNYNTVSGGFFIRYMFKQQYPTENYPTGLFPSAGFRSLRLP